MTIIQSLSAIIAVLQMTIGPITAMFAFGFFHFLRKDLQQRNETGVRNVLVYLKINFQQHAQTH
tara:strand:- start:2687 stop:2878 length:192 start_codon:yes stop_codon:yes gene_type:complete